MKKVTRSQRAVNNMVARIRAHYPHLYESTGSRYVRSVLKDLYGLSRRQERHSKLSS